MSGLEFEPRGAVLSEMGIGIPIPLPFDVDLDERKLQMHSGCGGSVRLLSAIVTNNWLVSLRCVVRALFTQKADSRPENRCCPKQTH